MRSESIVQRGAWVLVGSGAVVAAASIVFFWLNLPEWGYCIEEGPNRGCETGEFTSNAIAGTAAVLVGLALLVFGVVLARGERRRLVIAIAIAAFLALLLVGWVLQHAPLEEIPMPVAPHVS
jgi:hypothetical protein